MMHSCGICGDEYVDAEKATTNYLRATRQWICDICLDEDLKAQIAESPVAEPAPPEKEK